MSRRVTILMYHYVRDLKNSRYPEIKGLDFSLFQEQIRYVEKHYSVISMGELVHAIQNQRYQLPAAALLLTFDDGFSDHYCNVFPFLKERGLQGSFFPPAWPIAVQGVLDVHKIHFILASCPDKRVLIEEIFGLLAQYRSDFDLEEPKYYFEKLAQKGRYDTPEAVFVKRLLQAELPEESRRLFTNLLFQKHVSSDEKAFSQELYMSSAQIQTLSREGMAVGVHGYRHYWIEHLSPSAQENEIRLSLEFMRGLDLPTESWAICYPYGSYNETLLDILRRANCAVGMVSSGGIANVDEVDPLTLPRIDTNDIPVQGDAPPNAWTIEAQAGATKNSSLESGR